MAHGVIALVDDDSTIINLLRDLLGDEGYETFAVTGGAGVAAAIARGRAGPLLLRPWVGGPWRPPSRGCDRTSSCSTSGWSARIPGGQSMRRSGRTPPPRTSR